MSTISAFSNAAPPDAPPAGSPGASSQHDARGRFVKGNKGGPGNPLAGKVNKVRNAFLDYFAGPGMQVLCDFLFRKAMSGDPRFMRIILQYTVGRLPIDDSFMDAFNAALADTATAEDETAEDETVAELDDEIDEGAGDDAPVADARLQESRLQDADCSSPIANPHSDVGREERRTDPKPAAQSTGRAADLGQVSTPACSGVEVATPLGAAVADVSKRPHSKNRERLLKLMDQRDPLRGESSAGPPSTNGLGAAHHIPLVGT